MPLPLTRLVAIATLCLACASTALAQARIEDCETIQAADAYNQCLAKFGPTSKVKSVEPFQPSDVKDNSAEAAAGAASRSAATRAHRASRGHARAHGRRGASRGRRGRPSKAGTGRKRMTIVIHHK